MAWIGLVPEEILRNIFAYLPIASLENASNTCQMWHRIISDPNFLKYKKRYHKFKSGDEDIAWEVGTDILLEDPEAPDALTRSLPLVLDIIHKTNHTPLQFDGIERHAKYEMVAKIARRLGYILGEKPNPACCVALICLLADDYFDVENILSCLKSNPDDVRISSELLYQIATYFLHLERELKAPKKLSYRLHYALFWLENSQGPTELHQLTAEQKAILDHPIGGSETVRIIAYAGTGKTTTLRELCQKHTDKKFLLLVFNKDVQTISEKTFPKNVEARTCHSLAYRHVMNLGFSQRRIKFNLQLDEVLPKMSSRGPGSGNIMERAAQVIATIKNFCHSVDDEISMENVPSTWVRYSKAGAQLETLDAQRRSFILDDAENIWKEHLTNPRMTMAISCDVYMKIFQLAKPNFRDVTRSFDVLLVDEGQDLNPAMLDSCMRQPVPKFIVGDPHQQIYAFNGAINGLKMVAEYTTVSATYYLTQSFRFGPNIAYVATMALETLKRETSLPVIGTRCKDKIIERPVSQEPVAVLSRTNARLFAEIVDLVCKKEADKRPTIYVSTNTGQYYQNLKDLSYLKQGNLDMISRTAYGYMLKHIKHFEAFLEKAERTNAVDDIGKCDIVKTYSDRIPEFVDIIHAQSRPNMHDADYVFSTVHKFKGLEFGTVRLLEDFILGSMPFSAPSLNENEDEINLLYVALTRAKKRLIMNDSLYFMLVGLAGETFREYSDNPLVPVCCVCKNASTEAPFEVVEKSIEILRSVYRPGGSTCPGCSRFLARAVDKRMTTRQGVQFRREYTKDYQNMLIDGLYETKNPNIMESEPDYPLPTGPNYTASFANKVTLAAEDEPDQYFLDDDFDSSTSDWSSEED